MKRDTNHADAADIPSLKQIERELAEAEIIFAQVLEWRSVWQIETTKAFRKKAAAKLREIADWIEQED